MTKMIIELMDKLEEFGRHKNSRSFFKIIIIFFCVTFTSCAEKTTSLLSLEDNEQSSILLMGDQPVMSISSNGIAHLHNSPLSSDDQIQGFIVLIIDDMGLNHRFSSRAIKLPPEVTLSYLPYASGLKKQVTNASQAGHEIMLHLPMEAHQMTDQDKVPNILMVSMTPDELEKKINWAFSQIPEFTGVNNHMGSRFTEWSEGMEVLLGAIKKRGLFFLDSRTTAKSVAFAMAKKIELPFVQRDVFIDHFQNDEAIYQQLSRLENIALKRGYVVAIAHPHPQTIGILEKWVLTLPGKKLRLMSVQDLLKKFH